MNKLSYDPENKKHQEIALGVKARLVEALMTLPQGAPVRNGDITEVVLKEFFPKLTGDEACKMSCILGMFAEFHEQKLIQEIAQKGLDMIVVAQAEAPPGRKEDIH